MPWSASLAFPSHTLCAQGNKRNLLGTADLALLLMDDSRDTCGKGTNGPNYIGWAYVDFGCCMTVGAAHEVGHILGGMHSQAYYIPDTHKRTVMA